jgi:hypothetical protein
MSLPPEIFTIIHPYLSLHDISSLVLTNSEVNEWVGMNEVIREYYLAKSDAVNSFVRYACMYDCINLMMYLHRTKNIIPTTSIILASAYGSLSVVKYLCSIGEDPKIDNNTPIQTASLNGKLDVVKYLYSVGADPTNNYSIQWASECGHLSIVEYLCSVGVDPTSKDNLAIIRASQNGHLSVVEYLYSVGAVL